jgi:hypothetical protein
VGQEYKRYIFVPKTGVVKPKGIFIPFDVYEEAVLKRNLVA